MDRLTEKIILKLNPVRIYKIVCIGCAVVHMILVIMFKIFNAKFMMNFNIISVLLYIGLCMFCDEDNLNIVGTIAYFEIVLHGICATITLGWDYGFAMYLVCVVPLTFYLSFKKLITPMIMCLTTIILFIGLKYVTKSSWYEPFLVTDLSIPAITTIYIANTVISFIMLVVLSLIYNISSKRGQKAMQEKNQQLFELAYTDTLTKLNNRRSMFYLMQTALVGSKEQNSSFSIVLSDIDDFKKVNDFYGHNAGDLVLSEVGRVVNESLPQGASACRWGGEEILVLLPTFNSKDAINYAEKLRTTIEKLEFNYQEQSFGITMTFGICENSGQLSLDKMISNADKNLYKGKSQGKNCVVD